MFRKLDELTRNGVYRQTFTITYACHNSTDNYGVFEVRRSDWDDKWQPWHGKGTESDPMMCLEEFGYNTKAQAIEVLERWLNDVLIVERSNRRNFHYGRNTGYSKRPKH